MLTASTVDVQCPASRCRSGTAASDVRCASGLAFAIAACLVAVLASWSRGRCSRGAHGRPGRRLAAHRDLHHDEDDVEDDQAGSGGSTPTLPLAEQEERNRRHPEEPRETED